MAQLQAVSLADQVYQRVKQDIFDFVLLPHDRFSENQIAERYQVSRTPVRDALYALNALSGSEVGGDFAAQMSANRRGEVRLQALVRKTGLTAFRAAVVDTNDYAERLARAALQSIPEGEYSFSDVMDDDGAPAATRRQWSAK